MERIVTQAETGARVWQDRGGRTPGPGARPEAKIGLFFVSRRFGEIKSWCAMIRSFRELRAGAGKNGVAHRVYAVWA
jgi:hypothetical protein